MSRGLSQLDIITLDDELRSLDEFCSKPVATALLYCHAFGALPGEACDFARLAGTTSYEPQRRCTVLGRGRCVGREQASAPALGAQAHCLAHPDPVGNHALIGYICLRVILEPSLGPRRPDRRQVLPQL